MQGRSKVVFHLQSHIQGDIILTAKQSKKGKVTMKIHCTRPCLISYAVVVLFCTQHSEARDLRLRNDVDGFNDLILVVEKEQPNSRQGKTFGWPSRPPMPMPGGVMGPVPPPPMSPNPYHRPAVLDAVAAVGDFLLNVLQAVAQANAEIAISNGMGMGPRPPPPYYGGNDYYDSGSYSGEYYDGY